MSETKKLYAKLEWDNYRNDGDTSQVIEVKDLAEAVKQGTDKGASYLQTFEVTTVEIGGKPFTGEPENHSKRHYLGMDKVYTPAEVVEFDKTEGQQARDGLSGLFDVLSKNGLTDQVGDLKDALQQKSPVVEQAENDSPDARYVRLHFSGFVRMEAGETAWDRHGKQVWPAPKPSTAPKPMPVIP